MEKVIDRVTRAFVEAGEEPDRASRFAKIAVDAVNDRSKREAIEYDPDARFQDYRSKYLLKNPNARTQEQIKEASYERGSRAYERHLAGEGYADLAKAYGVSRSRIHQIIETGERLAKSRREKAITKWRATNPPQLVCPACGEKHYEGPELMCWGCEFIPKPIRRNATRLREAKR